MLQHFSTKLTLYKTPMQPGWFQHSAQDIGEGGRRKEKKREGEGKGKMGAAIRGDQRQPKGRGVLRTFAPAQWFAGRRKEERERERKREREREKCRSLADCDRRGARKAPGRLSPIIRFEARAICPCFNNAPVVDFTEKIQKKIMNRDFTIETGDLPLFQSERRGRAFQGDSQPSGGHGCPSPSFPLSFPLSNQRTAAQGRTSMGLHSPLQLSNGHRHSQLVLFLPSLSLPFSFFSSSSPSTSLSRRVGSGRHGSVPNRTASRWVWVPVPARQTLLQCFLRRSLAAPVQCIANFPTILLCSNWTSCFQLH